MNLRSILNMCLAGCAAILGGMGLLFAIWAFYESLLPFNEEGRYFDSAEAVVHHQQDVLGYALIAAGFFAGAILLLCVRCLLKRTFQKYQGKTEDL